MPNPPTKASVMQVSTNPAAQAIYPTLPYKRPVKYVAPAKRMIIAISTTRVPPPPSIRSIEPVPIGCTIAIVYLPFSSQFGVRPGLRHERNLSAYEPTQLTADRPSRAQARGVPRQ